MTKACRALTDYAFGALDLNRVELSCAADNRRSPAIPERLGFTFEGVRRQSEWLHDRFADHCFYSILRSEWGPNK